MWIPQRVRALARVGGLAWLAAVAPAACEDITAVQEDGSFALQVGDRAEASDFTVRFLSVPEDSRCPLDLSCTWAGDAIVRLDLSSHHYSDLVDLHLNTMRGPDSAELDGHVVELLDLTPSPYSGRYIPVGDYVARLRVLHY